MFGRVVSPAVSFEAGQPGVDAGSWGGEATIGLPAVERELLPGDLDVDGDRELVGAAAGAPT